VLLVNITTKRGKSQLIYAQIVSLQNTVEPRMQHRKIIASLAKQENLLKVPEVRQLFNARNVVLAPITMNWPVQIVNFVN
jgi:hypothetical protein